MRKGKLFKYLLSKIIVILIFPKRKPEIQLLSLNSKDQRARVGKESVSFNSLYWSLVKVKKGLYCQKKKPFTKKKDYKTKSFVSSIFNESMIKTNQSIILTASI